MALNEDAPRIKGVADIVFVVDVSGTMSDIIDAVKQYIAEFVDMLVNDPQSTVKDVRLGLVTHDVDGDARVHAVDFMAEPGDFRNALMNAPDGGTEYGLPAIDRALDFPWRPECRRYIVFFSDENVDGGHGPAFQNSKLQELAQKMSTLHVHFMGFNEEACPSYELLGKTPGSSYSVVSRSELVGPNMKELLAGIAKTVSMGVDQQVLGSVQRNLYSL